MFAFVWMRIAGRSPGQLTAQWLAPNWIMGTTMDTWGGLHSYSQSSQNSLSDDSTDAAALDGQHLES